MSDSNQAREEAMRIDREIRLNDPRLLESAVAIVLEREGKPRQHGSGTLFRFGQLSFLVTASHVVRAANQFPLYLLGCSERLVPLKGHRVFTPGGDDDAFDLAIWKLEQATIDALGPCRYLGQMDVASADDLGDDDYFLTGFPTAMADDSGEAEGVRGLGRLTLFTSRFDGDASGLPNYRHDCHLLLTSSGERLSTNGYEFPAALFGISGCGVWRTYATDIQGPWRPGRARIVAVQTSTYRSHSIIKATRWKNVGEILHARFPELRPSLQLFLPTGRL